ncbi:GntR family transcriptional regulator [Natronolimnohabitans sp. A-GB9]|uniref:helix-turn-helix transcriptional regulator n=1 Tax=Natronolimnohabitans sp. A-GB9 TaxID=3069757 RepID=UPI0027B22039|nr:hypothetical protein [Natronolimnohabitans sp. A-GB9]MDQ2051324.1 GntR family transcriptional regulator [Natronolimnohabitans sp. A-GB9]
MTGGQDPLLELTYKRGYILRAISTDGAEKRDLADELSDSRPTIDRAIRELEAEGLVVRIEGNCQLTLLGRLLYERYQEVRKDYKKFKSAKRLLQELGPSEPIDDRFLSGSTTIECPDRMPYGPTPITESMISQADTVRGILSRVLPESIESEELTDQEVKRTFVIHPGVVDATDSHRHPIIQRMNEESYEVLKTSETPDFDLLLIDDDLVFIRVYSQTGGQLLGMIKNDSDAAIKWGEELFRQKKRRAKRVLGGE